MVKNNNFFFKKLKIHKLLKILKEVSLHYKKNNIFFYEEQTEIGLRKFNQASFFGTVVIAASSLLGCILGGGYWTPFFFLCFYALLKQKTKKIIHPIWICFQGWAIIFIEIPSLAYAIAGKTLDPSVGLLDNGITWSERDLIMPFIYLASFFVILPIILRKKSEFVFLKRKKTIFSEKRFIFCLLVSVPILFLHIFLEKHFSNVQLIKKPSFLYELFRFVFYDTGIFLSLFLLNFCRPPQENKRNVILVHTILIATFVVYRLISGSKGSILSAILIGFLVPLCAAPILGLKQVILPKAWAIIASVPLGLVLYFWGLFFRYLTNQACPGFRNPTLCLKLINEQFKTPSSLFENVLIRLSTELNRYLLLSNDLFKNSDYPKKSEFLIYVGKNLANLLLPGTPFPENYFMSSLFMKTILERGEFISGDYFKLIRIQNTQPFTVFGAFILIFGYLAPFAFFFFCILIKKGINISQPSIAIGFLLFFLSALPMYGIEIVVQNTVMYIIVLTCVFYFREKLNHKK